jgi:hypothetical protein
MQSVLAKDLRLGNLILKNGKIYEITTLFFVDLHDGTIRENYNNNYVIEPIPITEEWILKFGFKRIEGNCERNYTNGVFHVFINSLNEVNFNFFPNFEWYKKIKYVHQLQNLYFALTGSELTVA